MTEYTEEQIAALNKAAERFLSLYPLIASSNGLTVDESLPEPIYKRVDQALSSYVQAEVDRSRKGRPAWGKERRLATAKTAEANWRQMRQRALGCTAAE